MEQQTSAAIPDRSLEFEDEPVVTRDTRIEQVLEDWHLSYELDQQFPLARLRVEDATQIREQAHRAPSSTVEQYHTHMKHGAVFPPIVISSNGFLVDGNTRVEACKRLGQKTFPAYKVKFPHLGMAKMLGAALNQMGGDRLSDGEIVIAAECMMREQYGDEAIARSLGRSVSHIRNVRRDRAFREAAERTGVMQLSVPKAVQRQLATIAHDEPFKAAVELVSRAKPAGKDVGALVERIEQTRSDAEALAVIQTTETQWGPVTGPPPHPPTRSRSKGKAALKKVQELLALAEAQPADIVLPNDEAAADAWRRLGTVVTQVLALYVKPS
jgi:ParB-like chromosome segregation protein Spo0J